MFAFAGVLRPPRGDVSQLPQNPFVHWVPERLRGRGSGVARGAGSVELYGQLVYADLETRVSETE